MSEMTLELDGVEDFRPIQGLALLWQIYSRCFSLQIHFLQRGHRCGGGRAMSSRMAWRTAGNVGRGATLRYLPQYSPDLNPIEMPFSKLKASLLKAAERTIPRLRRRIARFACTLAAREACNYFRHAGYK